MNTKESQELAVVNQFAGLDIVLDEGPQEAAAGIDTLGRDDFALPRLVLCQSMTPQRKRSEPSYITGLDEGMFFDNVNKTVYGEGPLYFAVVRILGTRYIEFNSPEDGGGVKDFNVQPGDPRTKFTDVVKDGKAIRVKPKATLFYDYLLLMLMPEGKSHLITLSLKGTQIKQAKKFNEILKTAKYGLWSIKSVPDHSDEFSFFNVKIERVEVQNKPASVPQAYRTQMDELADQYAGIATAEIIKDVDDDARVVDAQVADDKVPF